MHRNLVAACVEALQDIVMRGQAADRYIDGLLRSRRQWGSRDRRFVADTLYGTLRHYRRRAELAGRFPVQNPSDWWAVLAAGWWDEGLPLPDWAEFAGFDPKAAEQNRIALGDRTAWRESLPDWLCQRLDAELGAERCRHFAEQSNRPAPFFLRCNRLRCSPERLLDALRQAGIDAQIVETDALLLSKNQPLHHLKAAQNGWFEVQDLASQRIAPFLELEPGMTLADVCAGGGGKSLHAAALMRNQGRIWAMDVRHRSLLQLQTRAKRAGAGCIQTLPAPAGTPPCDRLLIDAPCSGLGTLRRHPDQKWKLRADFVDSVISVQKQLLQDHAPALRPGGKLVYATCSVLPSENEAVVRSFLESEVGSKFELEAERSLLPGDAGGGDGFYMARLRRLG